MPTREQRPQIPSSRRDSPFPSVESHGSSETHLPDGLLIQNGRAHAAAFEAYKIFVSLQNAHSERYYHLCPQTGPVEFYSHCRSIDRVLSWREQYDQTTDLAMTLHPALKLYRKSLFFYVSEKAYRAFFCSFNDHKKRFLKGAYRRWIGMRDSIDATLRAHRHGYDTPEMSMCVTWWMNFRKRMEGWEAEVQALNLPGFDDLVLELEQLVRAAVDVDEEDWC
ncbi:hypothetical protein KEM55_008358 [Ascosphaera atra]|nr:hypothetical protein KEM55_008358 [Ascosphaera atra]